MAEENHISINQALYQNAAKDLLSNAYGTRIVDAETGDRKDTGAQLVMEEVARVLMSGRLVLNQPLVIRTNVSGEPAIKVVFESRPGVDGVPGVQGVPGTNVPKGPIGGIQFIDAFTGEFSQIGIGLQNIGLVANEFVPNPNYFVNPEVAMQEFSTNGNGTGVSGATGYDPPTSRAEDGGTGSSGPASGTDFGGMVGPGQQPNYSGTGYNGGPNFPFVLGPMGYWFWYQQYGRPRPPGPTTKPPDGYTGTLSQQIVTDVSWNESTCVMTKTTKTLEIVVENGLITSLSAT